MSNKKSATRKPTCCSKYLRGVPYETNLLNTSETLRWCKDTDIFAFVMLWQPSSFPKRSFSHKPTNSKALHPNSTPHTSICRRRPTLPIQLFIISRPTAYNGKLTIQPCSLYIAIEVRKASGIWNFSENTFI
jgi:hypothetical protein